MTYYLKWPLDDSDPVTWYLSVSLYRYTYYFSTRVDTPRIHRDTPWIHREISRTKKDGMLLFVRKLAYLDLKNTLKKLRVLRNSILKKALFSVFQFISKTICYLKSEKSTWKLVKFCTFWKKRPNTIICAKMMTIWKKFEFWFSK